MSTTVTNDRPRRSVRLGLLSRETPSALEVAVAGVALLALGAAVFGSHVLNGSFYYDDWANSGHTAYPLEGDGYLGALETFWESTGYRPLLALYVPTVHELLGQHYGWHLGYALLLAVAMSLALYLVLRTLGVARLHAAAIAALVLIFPWSDATRLWATSATAHLTVALYLFGLVLALRALDPQRARGPALALHVASLLLYLASVLIYELPALAMLAGVTFYLLRAPPRQALPRWFVDLAVLVPTLVVTTSSSGIDTTSTVDGWLRHMRDIFDQALTVLARTAVPFGMPSEAAVLAVLGFIAAAGLLVWRLVPLPDDVRYDLRFWLLAAAGGLAAAAAAYAVFIPAHPYYVPLQVGVGNRVNAFAAIGLVIAVYALAVVAATLLFRGLGARRRLTAGAAIAAAVAMGVGYVDRIDHDKNRWDDAGARQHYLLGMLKERLGDPRPSSVIYMFGHPAYEAPGVPIFASSWDLNGAVRLLYGDGTLSAYPVLAGTSFACERGRLYPRGNGYGPGFSVEYGDVYFFDAASLSLEQPHDAMDCRNLTQRFVPGPLIVNPS